MEKTGDDKKGNKREGSSGIGGESKGEGNPTNQSVTGNASHSNRNLRIVGFKIVYSTLFETREYVGKLPPFTIPNIKDAQRVKSLLCNLYCELYQFISTNVSVELIYAEQ